MAAVIVWPPISTFTCAVVAPFFTSTILPLSRLRALIFMAPLLVAVALRPPPTGIGAEQFLPVDLVIRDRFLPLGRDEPVDEGLAERLLYVRMVLPLMPAGSLFGPIRTKSLYITGYRLTPKPSATNFSSCALACTNSTS